MYCYNCGQKINNSILTCPYCNHTFNSSKLDRVVFDRTVDTIAEACLTIPNPYNKTFRIADVDITITDELYLYGYINCFVNKLEDQFKTDLKEYIHTSLLSKLVDEGEDYLCEYFENNIYAILGYMTANGVSVTINTFFDLKSYLGRIPFIWESVYNLASQFNELQSLLDARLNAIDTPKRTTWVGGGFGIRGAIKGQIKAGIMNAGGTAIHSIGNSARRAIQSYKDYKNVRRAKNEIMESDEFVNAILSEAYEFYNDLRKYLLLELSNDSKKSKEIARKIIGKDNKRNIKLTKEQAIELLAKNPFNPTPYTCLYKQDRNNGAGLSELAVFCGIENEVYYEFLFNVDNDIFGETSLELHSVGFDTELDELLRIHQVLVDLEKDNPGFACMKDFVFAQKEQEYHQNVCALIVVAKKENAKKAITDAFSSLSKKEATKKLINLNDDLINNYLIRKFVDEVNTLGKFEFLMQFEGYYPLVVAYAALTEDYPKLYKTI